MGVRYITDKNGEKREVKVISTSLQKSITKDKLKRLSKHYRVKMINTPEDHDNYPVMKKLCDNLINKAIDEGLVGYKAKDIYQNKVGNEKDRYIKILQLTSR